VTAGGNALRVMVVDDEPTARQRIVRLLGEIPDVAVVAECGSGREALAEAAARRPDVVFLDIAMPGLDGLDVARRLGTPDARPVVVFVTAYDEHALAAFRVHAADYVLKPVDRERMRDAVEHARRSAGRAARPAPAEGAPRFAVRDGRRAHFVPVADILWVESFGNYARLHTAAARFIHRATMEAIAAQLAPHGFVRIHRTAIVNAARVVRLRPAGNGEYDAYLDTGARLRVSRTFRPNLDALWTG